MRLRINNFLKMWHDIHVVLLEKNVVFRIAYCVKNHYGIRNTFYAFEQFSL